MTIVALELPSGEDLARAYARTREPAMRAALIEGHLALVVSIAKRFAGIAELDDLIQEGAIGVSRAAERFNPERGAKFSTWAYAWARKHIFAAVRAAGLNRSEHAERLIRNEERAAAKLAQQLGREPSQDEVDTALGRSAAVAATSRAARVLRRRGDDRDLAGLLADNDLDAELDRRRHFERMRRALDEVAPAGSRARQVFDAHELDEKPVADVARELGLSRERAAALHRGVLQQLRRAMGAEPEGRGPQGELF